MKVKVDVEYVRFLKEELAAINKLDLSEIQFYEDDREIDISDEVLKEWQFTGLNNADFIVDDIYKLKKWE
jgi:hypothetical protein